MTHVRSALLLAIAGGLLACSHPPPTIAIKADKSATQFGPGSFVTLTITGTVLGATFPDAMSPSPQITATGGSFTDPSSGSSSTELTDAQVTGGKIVTKLYSPTDAPAKVTVTATVTDSYQQQATTSIVIDFQPPQVTTLIFQCKARNIDALITQDIGMSVGCQATAQDMNGKAIPSAHIQFMAEAGIVRPSDATDTALPNYVYYPHQGTVPAPQDVAPFSGEPKWTDSSNRIHNPRDGLATIVAYVEGQNDGFGDQFDGDPFVDINDNDQYDQGEPFVSASGDPTAPYNPKQTTLIWKQIKILWTGSLSSNPTVAKVQPVGATSYDLARNAHKVVQYQLVDDNFNALAVNNTAQDAIQWMLTPEGMVDFDAGQGATSPMKNSFGINIDEVHNYKILNPTAATSYLLDSLYTIKITNTRTMDDMNGPMPYSVSGTISRTGTIDESGQASDSQSSETLQSVGGTLQ